MIIREARTAGRIVVKPHINALGEREDRIWTDSDVWSFFYRERSLTSAPARVTMK
jgi:hypothetical protein